MQLQPTAGESKGDYMVGRNKLTFTGAVLYGRIRSCPNDLAQGMRAGTEEGVIVSVHKDIEVLCKKRTTYIRDTRLLHGQASGQTKPADRRALGLVGLGG